MGGGEGEGGTGRGFESVPHPFRVVNTFSGELLN